MSNPFLVTNIPHAYKKPLQNAMGGIVVPYYVCNSVIPEGAPVKLSADFTAVEPVTEGSCPSGTVFGLSTQKVYDPSNLGDLSGYQFHHNTWERKGAQIGVLTNGPFYAEVGVENFTTTPAVGDSIFPAASGLFRVTASGTDASLGVVEASGLNAYYRCRFDLPSRA